MTKGPAALTHTHVDMYFAFESMRFRLTELKRRHDGNFNMIENYMRDINSCHVHVCGIKWPSDVSKLEMRQVLVHFHCFFACEQTKAKESAKSERESHLKIRFIAYHG